MKIIRAWCGETPLIVIEGVVYLPSLTYRLPVQP